MSDKSQQEIEQLRISELKYRKMVEMANDAILTIDPDSGEVVEANPKTFELLGYSKDELIGMQVWELHPEDERDAADRLWQNVRTSGDGYRADLHFLNKSGKLIPIEVSASVIEFDNHRLIQRICRDLSEHRRLERRAARLSEYYQHILNFMPVGVGVRKNIGSDPEIEFENWRLKQMFAGRDTDDCVRCWSSDPKVSPDIQTTPRLDENGVYAEERVYPDGRVFLFSSSYYRDSANDWKELQVVQDITERRRLEDALREAKDDLERKVEQRTEALRRKQTQLIQAEKMASLGQLVAGVAHEINTPLGALKSNNDLFIRSLQRLQDEVKESGDDTTLTILEKIQQLNDVNRSALERIVNIVNSLRTFARLDRSEMDRVNVHQLLDSTLTLVHHELKNRIEVVRDYGELPDINCFPNQLNQVWMNLLVNASQAIKGKGRITIQTRSKNGSIEIEISDTGSGISQEHLERIFDPGFTTKGSGIGTGLGLSIVHQIIADHNGSIDVSSTPGEGTTFTITLPVTQD